MQYRVAVTRVVLACIAVSAGCSPAVDRKSVVGRAASKRESTQPVAPNVVTSQPLSEQGCRDFAQSVSKTVAAGDLVALNDLFDWNELYDVVLSGMEMTTKRRQDLALELPTGDEQGLFIYWPDDQERPGRRHLALSSKPERTKGDR